MTVLAFFLGLGVGVVLTGAAWKETETQQKPSGIKQAPLFATLQILGEDGEVLATRNEPLRPTAGGFCRIKDDDWVLRDVHLFEVREISMTFLGREMREDLLLVPTDGDKLVISLRKKMIEVQPPETDSWQ